MIPQNATIDIEIIEDQTSLTYGIDFNLGIVTGQIDELAALQQAVYLILNTERFKHEIFSWDYGVEFIDLIGTQTSFAYPEIERRIKEALLVDDRILGVVNFNFTRARNEVLVTFSVQSNLGELQAERTVTI